MLFYGSFSVTSHLSIRDSMILEISKDLKKFLNIFIFVFVACLSKCFSLLVITSMCLHCRCRRQNKKATRCNAMYASSSVNVTSVPSISRNKNDMYATIYVNVTKKYIL